MESISLRLEDGFSKDLEKFIKKYRYSTKTEFIREAIRDKINEIEKKELLERVEKLFKSSKKRTSKEALKMAGEKAFDELEREFK